MHDNPGVNFRRKCPRVGVFLCVFGAGDAYEVGDVGAGDADDVDDVDGSDANDVDDVDVDVE